jgi:hypothetical protein
MICARVRHDAGTLLECNQFVSRHLSPKYYSLHVLKQCPYLSIAGVKAPQAKVRRHEQFGCRYALSNLRKQSSQTVEATVWNGTIDETGAMLLGQVVWKVLEIVSGDYSESENSVGYRIR